MPQVALDLGTDLPANIKGTAATVIGSQFPPCGAVDISIHLGPANGAVVAHRPGVAVAADGSLDWSTVLLDRREAPQLRYPCDTQMTVVVRDSVAGVTTTTTATANVFCP